MGGSTSYELVPIFSTEHYTGSLGLVLLVIFASVLRFFLSANRETGTRCRLEQGGLTLLNYEVGGRALRTLLCLGHAGIKSKSDLAVLGFDGRNVCRLARRLLNIIL